MRSFILAAAVAAALCGTARADGAPDISGSWASTGPEAMGPIHATRAFTFTDRDWSVEFRAYADAQGTQPLFRIDVAGVYRLGGPSAAVPGAYEGIFPALRRDITAESAAGVAMFAEMGCALTQGTPKPLVDEGCGFLPPLMQAMGEYDLVALRDGQLYFGDRAGDLTKARPAALTPFPLARQ
jgi:hypothetical protein